MSTWLNWKFTNQSVSYALLLLFPFFVLPQCACTHLIRDLFLMLCCLSGTVTLPKEYHQTHSHLSDLTSSSYPVECVCVCPQKFVLTVFFVLLLLLFCMGCVLQFGEITHKIKEHILLLIIIVNFSFRIYSYTVYIYIWNHFTMEGRMYTDEP